MKRALALLILWVFIALLVLSLLFNRSHISAIPTHDQHSVYFHLDQTLPLFTVVIVTNDMHKSTQIATTAHVLLPLLSNVIIVTQGGTVASSGGPNGVIKNLPAKSTTSIPAARRMAVDYLKTLDKSDNEHLLFIDPSIDMTSITSTHLHHIAKSLEDPETSSRRAVNLSINVENAESKLTATKNGLTSYPEIGTYRPVWGTTSAPTTTTPRGATTVTHLPYPTPLFFGGAFALTLVSYAAIDPFLDEFTTSGSEADVDLSLALWLCGDGIDVLPTVRVTSVPEREKDEWREGELGKRWGKMVEGCKHDMAWYEREVVKRRSPPSANHANVVHPSKDKIDKIDTSQQQALPHPRAGALDANGVGPYLHDETALRLNPPEFEFGSDKEKLCASSKNDGHYDLLTKHVKVTEEVKENTKLFCAIYTYEKHHDSVLPVVRSTWAPKCDGFMVASTKTDDVLNTVEILHEGPEEYNNIWQKVRSIWAYIHEHYGEEYEWFYIGGDDVWLIVENLKLYLYSEEMVHAGANNTPLFLGRRFMEGGKIEKVFNSGGAGYLMNREALRLLVGQLDTCQPHLKGFWEDVMVNKCLGKEGVKPYDTKDELGRERFHPFNPGHHLHYAAPKNHPESDWYVTYSIDLKFGYECCSVDSATFHYVEPQLMKRLHALAYGLC